MSFKRSIKANRLKSKHARNMDLGCSVGNQAVLWMKSMKQKQTLSERTIMLGGVVSSGVNGAMQFSYLRLLFIGYVTQTCDAQKPEVGSDSSS